MVYVELNDVQNATNLREKGDVETEKQINQTYKTQTV